MAVPVSETEEDTEGVVAEGAVEGVVSDAAVTANETPAEE
jgi:hypothetical protein